MIGFIEDFAAFPIAFPIAFCIFPGQTGVQVLVQVSFTSSQV
jgi:hypothetical protein